MLAFPVEIVLIFLLPAKCDWIEITVPKADVDAQASPKVTFTTKYSNFVDTTTTTYETIMRRPATSSSIKVSTFVPEFRYDVYDANVQKNKSTSRNKNIQFIKPPQQSKAFATIHKINATPLSSSTETTTEKSKIPEYNSEDKINKNNAFLNFLKSIQQTLIKKSHNSIGSKLAVLKNLRDELLYDIQERMSRLYENKENREARGYKDEDSHMDFPSNEGALMTISFLTFAVFLIKLVLKLIYALKYKSQMATTTVAPTMAGAIIIGRKKRDTSYEEANRILQLIEEYTIS